MIPIWMYAVIAGIIFCAYMVIKTGREERQVENEIIEREGDIYMKRLEEEREMKRSEGV